MADEYVLPSDRPEVPSAAGAAAKPAEQPYLLPSEQEDRAIAKEAARPSQNPFVEGGRAFMESWQGVKEGLGPAATPTEGPWSSFKRVGSGLLSAAGLPFAFPMGVAKSLIAHPVAGALQATEAGIKKGVQQFKPDYDPKVQTHQEAYEAVLPGAEAALSALGPKRLPGGAVAVRPTAPTVGSGGISSEARLATKGGRETLAGQVLEKAATDPEAVLGGGATTTPPGQARPMSLPPPARDIPPTAPPELVPGSQRTTFQDTGDYGLGQLERVVQNTPEGQAAFQKRWADQNNARVEALRGVRTGGDPAEVSNGLRTAMQADDALGVLEEQRAIARAEQASAALGDNVPPEIQGQIYRRELDAAHQQVRAQERAAWDAVDPNRTLFVNSGPVSNAQFRIYGGMSEAAAAGMTEPERVISGIISRSPQTVGFQDMRDLRSLVSTSMREELRARGASPTYARLSQLRAAIEESTLSPVDATTGQFAPEAKARLDAASGITRQRAETFKQGPVEDVLKREGASGPFEVTNAAVPGRFIPNGPRGYDHVTSYLRAVGNERGLPDIYDALVSDMRSKTMDADGRINPTRLMNWARSKQDALRAVAERDGGALVQRLQNVEEAERAIADVVAQRNQLMRLHQEGVFGKLIGADNPTDVQNILGGLFGRQTSVGDAQAIMARLNASPEARAGAQQAVVDWIWDKFISSTAAGTSEENIIRADQFQNFIRLKEPVLRAFGFTPDQISTWQMISDDMRTTKQSIDATKMRGGPGTAQDLNALYRMEGTALKSSLMSRMMLHFGGGVFGFATEGPVGGALGALGGGVVSAMRDKGIRSVQELVKNAMLNPAEARRLLAKVRVQRNPKIKTWMGYEAAGQQQGDQQQPPPQGFKHGGAVRPLGREGIKARNKARAVAARERSTLARSTAQAKGKVKRAEGGTVPPPLTDAMKPRDLSEEERTYHPRSGFSALRENVLRPGPPPLTDAMRPRDLSEEERTYHPRKGYAEGGKVEDAAALFANNPTIDAIERMHQARKRAQGIDQPPTPPRVDTAQRATGLADGGSVKDDSSKASKKSVNYSKGMPKARCGICRFWSKGTCSKVKGTIYASMWCELFKGKTKYQEGGEVVAEEDPLEAELRRRNAPGGLSATAGSTVTSTTPVQDIPAPKVNSQGDTAPTYVLKEMGKGLLGAPEQFTHAAGDLQRRGEYAGSQEDMPYGGPPPEEMPAGAAAALMLYGANAPFPKPGIGVFGGRGALTANKGMLAEAEKMLAAGVPHATIRNRTGWEFGSDGKPKFEISDADARIKQEASGDRVEGGQGGASRDTGFRPNRRLEEVLDHPALYEAYPWLKDMRTSLEVGEKIRPGASYAPPTKNQKRFGKTGEIEVRAPTYDRGGVGDLFEKQKYSDTGARDMLLHEIQHAIQNHEGFAPGSNPSQLPMTQSDIRAITQNMAKREGLDWDAMKPGEREALERTIRYRIYKSQAGETEARNVQTRADDVLRQRPSWETEDIDRRFQSIENTPKERKAAGGKPFKDPKIYKSEYEGPEYRSEYKDDPAVQVAPAGAIKAPEVPVLLGNPELRGSMSTLDNMPFTYRGKGPAEWTPQEFAEVGKHFGVERLGPESPAKGFRYGDGEAFNIPGGLKGQFTYYDMLRMKADGIDPSRIPRELHVKLQQKLMRSMDVAQPVSPERTWSGLMFGMTSPNNPLFPNQLTQSILRMREPGLRQQLADSIPWKVGDQVPMKVRQEAGNRIAAMLGIDAESKGGLGTRGTADYTRIAELAQMWEKNPQWFTKTAAEDWPGYVERLTSQVTGTAMKTGSFGGVWQNPARAGISAIDRHMINEFERTGRLFPNRADQRAFEQRAVERWNNANEGRPVKNYRQLRQASGGEGFLTKMKLEYVGNEQQVKLRTAKGEISPNVPPHLANVQWPSEPSHVKVMGNAYRRALDWNQKLATQQGLSLFPSQWLVWDRIRRRFEPHENMFPGLERMPAMSREQLRKVSDEHTASGHKDYGKTEGEEGQMNLQPTRPRPNPGGFAYFTVPPVAGAAGAIRGLVNYEEE